MRKLFKKTNGFVIVPDQNEVRIRKTIVDFPELVKQWHPTKNGTIKPEEITAGSHKKYWWKCPEGPDHEWEALVYTRTRKQKSGCPFCSGFRASVTNSQLPYFQK